MVKVCGKLAAMFAREPFFGKGGFEQFYQFALSGDQCQLKESYK